MSGGTILRGDILSCDNGTRTPDKYIQTARPSCTTRWARSRSPNYTAYAHDAKCLGSKLSSSLATVVGHETRPGCTVHAILYQPHLNTRYKSYIVVQYNSGAAIRYMSNSGQTMFYCMKPPNIKAPKCTLFSFIFQGQMSQALTGLATAHCEHRWGQLTLESPFRIVESG